MKTSEVFGISTQVLPSYIDRGQLDETVKRDLSRSKHIAIRGESKCGKSWLRQKLIPNAIVVQCRLERELSDIYRDIFSQLGIDVAVEKTNDLSSQTVFSAESEFGTGILARIKAKLDLSVGAKVGKKFQVIGRDVDDLRFVSEVIKESGKRLVIEDFHYLSKKIRSEFAHDLKAFWDYELYVIIIGIWNDNNMLVHLCPDLSNRIVERSIYWNNDDLMAVVQKGSRELNVEFSQNVAERLVNDSFGTVGLLQNFLLNYLDEVELFEKQKNLVVLDNLSVYDNVALEAADQLNAVYQTFANRVVKGIRKRRNSTGIYAHTLKAVMDCSDEQLTAGISADDIFDVAHKREARIQKPNLKQILNKIDELQVDDGGRGLIISYVPSREEVTVVDKQLFFYRKYATVKWPWDEVISEVGSSDERFEFDQDDDT